MLWEVIVPDDDEEAQAASITVEADNWFSALRSGLTKHGLDGQGVSNITCDIKPDRSVHVTDFVTRKVYMLRPMGEESAQPKAQASQPPRSEPKAPAKAARRAEPKAPTKAARRAEPKAVPMAMPQPVVPVAPAKGVVSQISSDLPVHKVFYWKDNAHDDGSAIYDRERLIFVAPGTNKDAAAKIAVEYYHRLKAMGSDEGTKLVISVQIYDHEFQKRSVRPAIAALSWKAWSPKKASVQFPLTEDEGIRLSRMPQPPIVAAAEPVLELQPKVVEKPVIQAQPVPQPVLQPKVIEKPVIQAQPVPEPVSAPAILSELIEQPHTPAAPVRKPDPIPLVPVTQAPVAKPETVEKKKIPSRELAVDDAIVRAFERMQDIYSVTRHDDAALFALNLAREFIDCEAASAMLITPGKYELYVAAAQGDAASKLMGKKLSLTKGIVGFATRAGAVITVSDPKNDPRFHAEFDQLSGFITRSIVCAPIQYEGKTIGAVELINSPRESGFLQSEANVLSYIAGAVGEYIDTSLPSREADFSDKDFAEFLPAKKAPPKKKARASKKPAEKKPATAMATATATATVKAKAKAKASGKKSRAAAKPTKKTATETPTAKQAAAGKGSAKPKKKKKKRKR